MSASVRWLPLALAVLLALPAQAQESFTTPDAAAEAFVQALGTKTADEARLTAILGPTWEQVVPRGSVDRDDVDAFLARYREKHVFQKKDATHQMLAVGNDAWTLPLPLVKGASGWTFDIKAGELEIRARRIGRNEREAEQAVLAYHDAQIDYASEDRNGNGVLEYAQKFVSTDGKHDGLYWTDDDGGEESPLGPLFGDDTPQGIWHGYRYRILTAQGPSAPGGAYDYKLGNAMSRGFALIAWPAEYGESGVMSFMISHEGEVFEKDLGPDSDQEARLMTNFDPDSSWVEVKDTKTAATKPE